MPSGFTIGFSFASASIEVSRGCSSRSTTTGSPFLAGIVTGTISRSKRPDCCAAEAFACERSAKASWSARDTPHSAATFSAVSGIESVPYICFISGFTKRHPIVVSNTAFSRAKADCAFGITNGARDMLSTPPAMPSSISPAAIARAMVPTASMPEPQSRLIVAAGISFGRPASSSPIRATLRLSSPAWFAQPNTTSSTALQSTDG